MVEYIINPQDIPMMVDSLIELFQESDKVTPKMLAERMTIKLGRYFNYHHVSYLFTLFGFVTSPSKEYATRTVRYLVRNDELLVKLKAESYHKVK